MVWLFVLRRRSSDGAGCVTVWRAGRSQRSLLRQHSIQMESVDDLCLRAGLLPHSRGFPHRFAAAVSRNPKLYHAQHSIGVRGDLYILVGVSEPRAVATEPFGIWHLAFDISIFEKRNELGY